MAKKVSSEPSPSPSPRPNPSPNPNPSPSPSSRPKPGELIAYYESQGMDRGAASEHVIEDLQNALQIAIERGRPTARMLSSLDRTLRSSRDASTRGMALLEAKVDAKPDLPHVFVAALAAGALLQGVPFAARAAASLIGNLRKTFSKDPGS